MRKIALILLSLMLVATIPAAAQDVSVGSVTYYCDGAIGFVKLK